MNPRLTSYYLFIRQKKNQETSMMNSPVCVRSSSFILVTIFLNLFTFFSAVSSDEHVFVVGETGSLQVTPRTDVIDSPGLQRVMTSMCERLHIHGLHRFKHIDRYAHSLKLTLLNKNASNSIDVCFDRNSSRTGMCPHGQWKKMSNGLSWVGIMSPFDYKILDIRTFGDSSEVVTLEFSVKQELFMYRIVFLIMGIVLLSFASRLSTSIFVSWSIRMFAMVMILQSSLDPFLAGGALISVILISSIVKSTIRKLLYKNCSHATSFASPLPKGTRKRSKRTILLSDSDTFLSSFHKTPEGRRKLTMEELEKFTKESTEKAMKELVSSPGFGEWAVKNAKRISVNPVNGSASKLTETVKRRRWFLWF